MRVREFEFIDKVLWQVPDIDLINTISIVLGLYRSVFPIASIFKSLPITPQIAGVR